MKGQPARGLPPRVYVPILAVTTVLFLCVVGYFLHIALSVTGAALGPAVRTDVGNGSAAGPNGVGGGTPVPANAGAPPAPVARLLVDLRDRVARNPRDVTALVSLGDMYATAGKFEQAAGYYGRALRVEPDRTDALYGAGLSAESLGRRRQAVADFRRFLAVAPHDGRTRAVHAALERLGG